MSKKVSIQFYIKDISTLEFLIKNPPSGKNAVSDKVVFQVTPSSSVDIPSKTIDILTFIGISLDDKGENKVCELITSIKFGIGNLEEFIDEKDSNLINLPNQFMQTLLSISLSTSRGILSVKTEGTVLKDIYLPIVNPSKLKLIDKPILEVEK